MAQNDEVYTYRAGQKVVLEKKTNQFVVRALPEELERMGLGEAEQVSSSSSRVTVRDADLEPMMSLSRHVAPTHHAYHVADTGEEFLITDRVFVTFRASPTPEQLDEFVGRYALVELEAYSDREYLFQLTDHTGMNPVKLVVKLMEDEPLVEMADHDLNYRASTYQQLDLPTDPSYVRQWHLHRRFSHPDFDPSTSSRCEEAWQLLGGYGSSDVVISVTDDGCKLDHPDFDSPGKFAGWGYFEGRNLITQDDVQADPGDMYQTGANHGTSCAGVAAGEADAVLTVGAAPGCRLLPIKWESEGPYLLISDSKMLAALDYLADKVDVVSNSWGGVPTNMRTSILRNRIIQLAESGGRRGKGIVFLWAAGNENCPIQHTTDIDVPYTNGWSFRPDGSAVWVGVRTSRVFRNNLVDVPGVMHVAALASTGQRSHYSNYGTGITLCAPTNNVHKYYRLTVRGLGITTATGETGDVTQRFGGTSSATPLVAGIAALVISAHPELTAFEVVSILKRTASKELRLEGYPRTPPASFDPDTSWDVSPIAPFDQGDFTDIQDPDGTWSPWFGHGRVDAFAAVDAAQQMREETVQEISYSSSPESEIPDDTPEGIHDIINVPDFGRVQAIRVNVDITHTWIGDLRITLGAPDGTSVLLHNRSGSNRDNIQQTFDGAAVPTLAALRGHDVHGAWTLHVQDLAQRDVGTLNNWGLEITTLPGALVVEDNASVTIPDRDPAGISRTLEQPTSLVIQDLKVAVDITHPWIGDLRVTLTPPDGASVRLHDRAGGRADNLVETYRSQDVAGLGALRGRDAAGIWQLHVADLAQRDVGKLNRWRIEIEG